MAAAIAFLLERQRVRVHAAPPRNAHISGVGRRRCDPMPASHNPALQRIRNPPSSRTCRFKSCRWRLQVNVRFRPRRQEDRPIDLPAGSTAGDLVAAVGEPTDMIVVVRQGTPIPEDEVLTDGEDILLLSAASGG